MASDAVIDFEALLAPIPGDDPSGAAAPFELKQKLEQLRKVESPDSYAEDDPTRPAATTPADFRGVVRLTTQALERSSKDLLLAARLTEALTKEHGFAGLRDGIVLLHRLITECWDRLRPALEEPDDLELRAGPFEWLDDDDRGAWFPMTIRKVPFVAGGDAVYSWFDWKNTADGKGEVTRDQFEKAVAAMSREALDGVLADLDAALEKLQGLNLALQEKMGAAAPGMFSVRQALMECRGLAAQIAAKKPGALVPADGGGAESAGVTAGADGVALGGGGQGGIAGAIQTRAQAYQLLIRAADVLQQIEPHSPIPYLVKRAVHLGQMSFPDLLREMVRDDDVVTALRREFKLPEVAEEN